MVHQFREFEQRHVSASFGVLILIDFPCPCLAHGMGREVVYPQLILNLDGLELTVYHLQGYDGAIAVKETGALGILDTHRRVAVLYMTLEALVDSDNAALSRLVLP